MDLHCIVVAAFGRILRKSLLEMPAYGCINVHASLLPRWRGASPIHHAILAGDDNTGVSIMRMSRGLDAGPVYAQTELAIGVTALKTELERELSLKGAQLLIDTLPTIASTVPVPQDEEQVTYAPIISKEMGFVSFTQSGQHIERMTRAFHEWPGVMCTLDDLPLKLVEVVALAHPHQESPGTIIHSDKRTCRVACGQNTIIDLLQVQPAGKSVMPIQAFLNGHPLKSGQKLTAIRTPV